MPFRLQFDASADAARVVRSWNRLHQRLPAVADDLSRRVVRDTHDRMETDIRRTLRLQDDTFFTGRRDAQGRAQGASRRRGRLYQRDFSIYFGFNPIPVEWPAGNVQVGSEGIDLFLNTQRHVRVAGVVGSLRGEIPHSWFFRGRRGSLASHRNLPGLPVVRTEFGNDRLFMPDPATRSSFERLTTHIDAEAQQVVNRTLRYARERLHNQTQLTVQRLLDSDNDRRQ